MGLLVDAEGHQDIEALSTFAVSIADYWNDYGGVNNGFKLRVGTDQVRAASALGHSVLSDRFPYPSPFKRVATLLIVGRLYPFFGLATTDCPPDDFVAVDLPDPTKRKWLARILALLVKPVLDALEINVSSDDRVPKWMPLDKWAGYPSPHFKLEFIELLEWLDSYAWPPIELGYDQWDQTSRNRLARIILAAALIIEVCYYCSEGPLPLPGENHIRGKCSRCLKGVDMTSITYDVALYNNYRTLNP